MIKTSPVTVFFVVYSVIFLATRLINLTLLPIHNDEIIHLLRVKEIINDGDIFIGLAQGLKGFQLWSIALLMWLPAEELWIGRLVSALAGLAGGLGCYLIAVELYKRIEIGIIASLLYLLIPFLFFYDRIALADSLLTALSVWVMVFSLWVVRYQRLHWAIAAGLVMGAASLTKASGLMNLMIPITAFLFLAPSLKSIRLWRLIVIVYALAAAIITVLLFFMVTSDNLTPYVREHGVLSQIWLENAQTALSWLTSQLTLPIFILGVLGIILSLLLRDRRGVLLIVLPLIWTAFLILTVRTDTLFIFRKWYPRYLLPITPSVIILSAWVLGLFYQQLAKFGLPARWRLPLFSVVLLAVLAPSLSTGFWLLADPAQAPLHEEERRQYIEGWPTTYGLAEAAEYLETLAQSQDEIYLAINDSSLIVEEGLRFYFDQPENVEIITFDPTSGYAIDELNQWSLERPTYLILNTSHEKGLEVVWEQPDLFVQAQKLSSYAKPGGQATVDVYQWFSTPGVTALWATQSGLENPLVLSQHGQVPDAQQVTQVGTLTESELANADFLLIEADVLQNNAFAPYLQTDGAQVWIGQPPPGLALTLFYPGMPCTWCVFRVSDNAPPQHKVQSILADSIALTGFDLDQQSYATDEVVRLTLHWQSIQPVAEDYVVFAQLVGSDGLLYAQQDQQPFHGRWPTSRWQPGQLFADRYNIPLNADMPVGGYTLIIGMYHSETGARLEARGENQELWPDNAIILTKVEVDESAK